MTTVFISGSIKIRHVHTDVQVRIMNILSMEYDVIVGDADGADSAIQQFLFDRGARKVTVYCTGDKPRNNIGGWPVRHVTSYHPKGSRAYFSAKDVAMAAAADLGLMVWDCMSTGTLSNVIELLGRGRKSLVFHNEEKQFHKILSVGDLQMLIGRMADAARLKADTKIDLVSRVAHLQSRALQDEILAARAAQPRFRAGQHGGNSLPQDVPLELDPTTS
ncbi:hypothetical protein RBA41_29700 [Massilia sp. CCM 9210]|uniref:hypothetical protein n=1 Tax=Massilia scottii TaxID=3057166 RepID=UPI00279642E7|nr:hypothetical protein [Massilia sp. CCM 9210]MDQ1817488.1 hypothetical protein [Massilia sp. CCM 9210]